MALTPKQERFCEEYLIDLNASAAYQRAGYEAKGNAAEAAASRLLRNVKVAARIAELQQRRSERTEIKADQVLAEIARLAFSDIGHVLDFDGDTLALKRPKDISEDARRSLASVKVRRVYEGTGDDRTPVDVIEFKLWPKPEALRDLGRHLKLFTDNVHIDNLDAALAAELGRLEAQDAEALPPDGERPAGAGGAPGQGEGGGAGADSGDGGAGTGSG